jgi:hypothetical protein
VTIVGVIERGYRGLTLTSSPDIVFPFHVIADLGSEHTNYFAEPIPPAMSSPTAGVGIIGTLSPGVTPSRRPNGCRAWACRRPILAGRRDAFRAPGCRSTSLTDINTAAIPRRRAPAWRSSRSCSGRRSACCC